MAEFKTLARPYAKAIFALAHESGLYAEWGTVLANLAEIVSHPDMLHFLRNQTIPRGEKAQLILEVGGEHFNDRGANLIRLLADNERLNLVHEIVILYEQFRREAEQIVNALVVTASKVEKSQMDKMQAALEQRFSRKVALSCSVDQKIMGGAVIRAEGDVIDGSTLGRLALLQESLLG